MNLQEPAVDSVESTDPEVSVDPPQERSSTPRRLAWLGVVAVAISAVVSSNIGSIRDAVFGNVIPEAAEPAPGRVAGDPSPVFEATPTALRSQPWWQEVATLSGSGPGTSDELTIAGGAIQWRVEWECQSGSMTVTAPGVGEPLAEGSCPGSGTGYATTTGTTRLEVSSPGPWSMAVAQQIDTPLSEPPLPEMTAPGASVVSQGTFYDIDKTGEGTATVYRLADGSHWLRLESFFSSPNVDLELRFSPLVPRTSAEYLEGPSQLVSTLDVTAGSINYRIPDHIDPTDYSSVVVWCEPVLSAYSAAQLEPA